MPKVIKQDEISQNYCQGPYFCSMMKLIIYGMLIYFLYKVIFQVVVPVSKGVKTVRANMEKMQQQQAEAMKKKERATFKLLEARSTQGIVHQIVKAAEASRPKMRYVSPWNQGFGIRLARIFGV
jgi:hypothetical protein